MPVVQLSPAARRIATALLAVSAVILLALALTVQRPATAQEASMEDEAMAALTAWWGSLVAGNLEGIAAVLAPEFQIMRADASGYDRAGYLASSLPQLAALPEFSALVVTAHGDHLVTRYLVTADETRDGQVVEAHAPRLTVFRREGDIWLVVAHGNFAVLQGPAAQ